MNDGGPAFPLQSIGPEFSAGYCGMTLRDYFAARAMQAGISRWGGAGSMHDEGGIAHSMLAEQAYQIADAMLKAREKT